jgi:uncharacterized protein YcfL
MRVAVFAIVLLLFSGCMHKNVSNVTYDSMDKNVINNELLQEKVAIISHRDRINNDLLQMQVTIQNLTDDTYELEYKVTWLDGSGFNLDSTPWLPLTLNGRERRNIEQLAHTQKARDYKFQIRPKQEGE